MAAPVISQQGTASRPADSPNGHRDSGKIAQIYQIRLEVRGDKQLLSSGKNIFPIVANLPERYSIDFSSSWSSPFAKSDLSSLAGLAGGAAGEAIAAGALAVAGISSKLKSQSVQVWDSTSPMSFSVQMIFNAETNSEADVRDKHRALLKLCAPSEGPGGVLFQPGPTIAGKVGDMLRTSDTSRNITLFLGRYIMLDNVIIKGVSSDVSTLCDIKGIPINMTINLQVESFYSSFTSEDIDKMFSPI